MAPDSMTGRGQMTLVGRIRIGMEVNPTIILVTNIVWKRLVPLPHGMIDRVMYREDIFANSMVSL